MAKNPVVLAEEMNQECPAECALRCCEKVTR